MSADLLLLLTHGAATWFMTGLIWFVQVVHYPLFGAVGPSQFPSYALRHQQRTTWVVGPPMLAELATALLLVAARPAGIPAALAWAGLAVLAVIWLSTALVQVPCHARLSSGFDERVIPRLVVSNGIRTAGWTVRGVMALAMLATVTPGG